MSSRIKGKSKLPEAPDRWLCKECGHVSATYLTGINPFDSIDTITGCESCKEVESVIAACWKCNRAGTMGCNDAKEYRYVHSCYEHRPKE